ncbi:MAG TPA: hypothetical protein VNR67_05200 [Solirubrobacterales bacterium]|nr:hypothetical protein [Solirubrobacterales bacterium]
MAELEARIDEAVVIARASEDGVREVGEMALDAAKQARRAAEMAESASVAAKEAASKAGEAGSTGIGGPAGPVSGTSPSPIGEGPASSSPTGRDAGGKTARDERPREVVIDPLTRFNQRADALAARLEKLTT